MQFDMGAAQQFIGAITGDLGTPCTWQTISDKKGTPNLNKVIHGPLHEVEDELKNLNRRGAGIFLTINETNLSGRKAADIVSLRALFVDSDAGPVKNAPLPPTLRVRSARGDHVYWVLKPGEDLRLFPKAQKEIAEVLGTDPSISDLPRVMRVPGFWHVKNGPVQVQLTELGDRKYRIDEILASLTLVNEDLGHEETPGPLADESDESISEEDENVVYARRALSGEIGRIIMATEGGRHQAIVAAATAMGEIVAGGGIDKKTVRTKIKEAAKLASKNGTRVIDEKEIESCLQYGIRKGKKKPRSKKSAKEKSETRGPRPNDMARDLIGDHVLMRDAYDNTYRYNGRYWEPISINQLKSIALRYDAPACTSERRRSETVHRVLADGSVQKGRISWNNISGDEVPLEAGVLRIGNERLRMHSRSEFLDKAIDVDYHRGAECVEWRSCLSKWFDGDSESDLKISALQEFFGYILLNHARYKKALMIYGQPDSGKSVVVGIIRELVGDHNCCQIRVDKMDDPRALAPIKGKMVNLMTELPDDVMVADGGFKQLVSTGEAIEIDPKYQQPEIYIPTCKHVFASNSLPNINDKTAATFNRLLVVRFNNRIAKKNQDPDLHDKLCVELPGIFNWSLIGARRLVENKGRFTEIEESRQIIAEHEAEQNAVAMFVEEFWTRGLDVQMTSFVNFCELFNKWHPGRSWHPRTIGKSLTGLGIKRKTSNGRRMIVGLERRQIGS
jgi:P4 family phage/plasmid primase-like protien